jgi:hypothetical protein
MSDPRPDLSASVPPATSPAPAETALFAARPAERERSSLTAWIVAGAVVLLLLGGILLGTHHAPKPSSNTPQPVDAYAASLPISGIQMSESASLSAVKVTYLDGHIRNTGTRTVQDATVQVLFANDEQLPPQIETVPLTLIRTHEPYIDTEPIRSAPIRPGEDREFRLILENIGANWNQQIPEIRIIKVD